MHIVGWKIHLACVVDNSLVHHYSFFCRTIFLALTISKNLRLLLALLHYCVKISFPGFFLTKIFHPNVASNGEICVNTLKKDWKQDLGVKHILLVSLLWYYVYVVVILAFWELQDLFRGVDKTWAGPWATLWATLWATIWATPRKTKNKKIYIKNIKIKGKII